MADIPLEKPVLVQLRLAPALAKRLREDGAPARRKLPAEIIHRLQEGAASAVGPTAELLDDIKQLSWRLEIDAHWYEDRFIFEAFKAGVLELLAQYQPEGEPIVIPGRHIIFSEGDDPATAGRITARQMMQKFGKARTP